MPILIGSRFPFLNVNTWLSRTTMPNGLSRKIATHTAGMVPARRKNRIALISTHPRKLRKMHRPPACALQD
jgi:hypothetical protein